MRRILAAFGAQAALTLAVLSAVLPDDPRLVGAFVAGLAIFGSSALILCWVAERMLGSGGGGTPTPGGIGWFVVGLMGKMTVLGSGCYLAFTVLALPVLGVLAGALAALVFVCLAAALPVFLSTFSQSSS